MSDAPHDLGHDDESLATVAAARRAAADRLVTPWWYHPVLGVLFGLYAVALASGEPWLMVAGIVVFFAGVGLLVWSYRRLTGMWISGYQPGPASRWAQLMGVVGALGSLAAMLLAWYTDVAFGWIWVIAAALALGVVVTGRQYDRVLRADLRGEL
ncbi:hypothetical protein [Aeromicrobium alkaliterrae]|uniref:DUF4175 domain-containing protein n=1 Tax=Aeromicrobium alkaliterrae TaxID=302168 RepID=A0ABP4VYF8_9ACTN